MNNCKPFCLKAERVLLLVAALFITIVTSCSDGKELFSDEDRTSTDVWRTELPSDDERIDTDQDPQPKLPNVVFILADDIGWVDVGAAFRHITGEKNVVETPNLDRLATEGMMFTDSHTPSALCAPNRFSFMTGSNPYRSRPTGTWNATASTGLHYGASENSREDNPHRTIGDVLQAVGYKTGFFGKMHLGGDFYDKDGVLLRDLKASELRNIDFGRRFRNGLLDHGFDYTFSMPSGIQGPLYAYFENDTWTRVSDLVANEKIEGVDAANASFLKEWVRMEMFGNGGFIANGYGDSEFDTSEHGPILAHKARRFIINHISTYNSDVPFLLYYAAPAIHVPFTPSTAGIEADGATGLGKRSDFVFELDAQVGIILRTLDEFSLAENTIVVFTSDNGGWFADFDPVVAAGQRPTGPLREKKASLYEGGHRVPFIWRWGNGTENSSQIPPGSVCDEMVSTNDWVGTIMDIVGQEPEAFQQMDTTSLVPWLTGSIGSSEKRAHKYLHQRGRIVPKGEDGFGVHINDGKRWFYRRAKSDTPMELYNIDDDIGQISNLVAGFAGPADLPDGHPHRVRIEKAEAWFLAHDGPLDPSTTRTIPASGKGAEESGATKR